MGAYDNVKGSKEVFQRQSTFFSPMKRVISLLEELDRNRLIVAKKEQELEEAKRDMYEVEKRVKSELAGLDPTTMDLFRGILSQQEDSFLDKKGPEGRTR